MFEELPAGIVTSAIRCCKIKDLGHEFYGLERLRERKVPDTVIGKLRRTYEYGSVWGNRHVIHGTCLARPPPSGKMPSGNPLSLQVALVAQSAAKVW